MKVYVLVEVFQLVVSGAYVTFDLLKAKQRFREYTGVDYDVLQKHLEADGDAKPEELLGDFDQTKIFEFDLKGPYFEFDLKKEVRTNG